MRNKGRLLSVFLIIGALIQMVSGIQVSVSGGGDGQETGSVFMDLNAPTDSTVSASYSVNGADIRPTLRINGIASFDETHQVTDSRGKHAEVRAKVVNGLNPVYSSIVFPGEGYVRASPYASAKQFLTVDNADQITCSATASNSKGMQASVGIEIIQGSLKDYMATAIAEERDVIASQSFESATSDYTRSHGITLTTEAFNKEWDNAKLNLVGDKFIEGSASLSKYSGNAVATKTFVDVHQKLNAEAGDTQATSEAYNAEGDYVFLYLENFDVLNGYSNSAYSKRNEVMASQTANSASCAAFYSQGWANNAEGDYAELGLGLHGLSTPPLGDPVHCSANLNEYFGIIKARKISVTASQELDSGSAGFDSWGQSYNRGGDYARASAYIWKSTWGTSLPSINGYSTSANADRRKADVSETILDVSAPDYKIDLNIEGIHFCGEIGSEKYDRSYGRTFLEKGNLDKKASIPAYSAFASASLYGTKAEQTKIRGNGAKLEVYAEAMNYNYDRIASANDERSNENSEFSTKASTGNGWYGLANANAKYVGSY